MIVPWDVRVSKLLHQEWRHPVKQRHAHALRQPPAATGVLYRVILHRPQFAAKFALGTLPIPAVFDRLAMLLVHCRSPPDQCPRRSKQNQFGHAAAATAESRSPQIPGARRQSKGLPSVSIFLWAPAYFVLRRTPVSECMPSLDFCCQRAIASRRRVSLVWVPSPDVEALVRPSAVAVPQLFLFRPHAASSPLRSFRQIRGRLEFRGRIANRFSLSHKKHHAQIGRRTWNCRLWLLGKGCTKGAPWVNRMRVHRSTSQVENCGGL